MRKNNKIYDIFKSFIKNNYGTIILLIILSFLCFYKTDYSIYKPGGIINASQRVSGDNLYKSEGSFNMAYVGMMEGKLLFYLYAKINPNWELVKNEKLTIDSEEKVEDMIKRDHLYYEEAINNATIVAFKAANIDYNITNNNYYLIYKTKENDSNINIGNEIISYDNIPFKDTETLIKYINNKKAGDKVKIEYINNKKQQETYSTIYQEKDKLYLGLSIINIKDIKSDYNIKIKSKESESGPSGGFITALSIYNAITKKDITYGKKIVGTGTIDENGNIGEIGSVNYKLAAAVKNKADIFLCPKDNYQEAIDYAKKKKYDIIIKDVENFNETIEYLNSLEG